MNSLDKKASHLETYFSSFRGNIVGVDQYFEGPYGTKKSDICGDWTASGRLYKHTHSSIY